MSERDETEERTVIPVERLCIGYGIDAHESTEPVSEEFLCLGCLAELRADGPSPRFGWRLTEKGEREVREG